MASPRNKPVFTVDQYLTLERHAYERHEYLDGYIYAMAGESGAHADITVNIVASLATQLRGKPCRVRSKDTKVRSGPTPRSPGRDIQGLYSYPDVVVVCDEPIYHDDYQDVLLNPSALIEVLSPATEEFDRGEKSERYRTWNPSLTIYLLVAQDRPHVQVFKRPDGDSPWMEQNFSGLDSTIPLPPPWVYPGPEGCLRPGGISSGSRDYETHGFLRDVYDRVEFPA